MRRVGAAVVLGLLFSAAASGGEPAPAADRLPAMQEAAAKYLDAKDDAERAKLAPALEAFPKITKEEFAAVVAWLSARHAAGFPAAAPGLHDHEAVMAHVPPAKPGGKEETNVKTAYRVWLPKGYDPKKAYPCMVYLNSQLGTDSATAFSAPAPEWIGMGVAKRLPFYAGRGLSQVNCPVDDALGRYHLDPDRIYLGGYSAGEAYALDEAGMNPDFYAGVLGCSGHEGTAELFNLASMAVCLLHGEKDFNRGIGEGLKARFARDGVACEFRIAPGEGHSSCTSLWPEARKWLEAHPRPTYPKSLKLRHRGWSNSGDPGRGWKRHFWTCGFVRDAHNAGNFQIVGQVQGQAVSVTAQNLDGLEVYLNDQMVNLDQPVQILVQGQAAPLAGGRSLKVLLDYHRRDPHSGFHFAAKMAFGQGR